MCRDILKIILLQVTLYKKSSIKIIYIYIKFIYIYIYIYTYIYLLLYFKYFI